MRGPIGRWFLLGVLLAGVIEALLPADLPVLAGGGILSMLAMLAVGLPLYVCASGSTPIAAALALKGLSPGAALVFLLAGPATNAASATLLLHALGRRATLLYLGAVAASAVLCGLAVDALYLRLGLDTAAWAAGPASQEATLLAVPSALALLVLPLAQPWWRTAGPGTPPAGQQGPATRQAGGKS